MKRVVAGLTVLLILLFAQAAYIPSAVKSVTAVSITVNAAASSNTQTVAVTKANSLLISGWSGMAAEQFYECFPQAQITNGTTLTATRGDGSGCAQSIWKGYLIEYAALFVKSSGVGTINIAAATTSNTATITSVNTAKTIVAWTGMTTTTTCADVVSATNGHVSTVVLTNATTITASISNQSAGACTYVVGYSYLEFR